MSSILIKRRGSKGREGGGRRKGVPWVINPLLKISTLGIVKCTSYLKLGVMLVGGGPTEKNISIKTHRTHSFTQVLTLDYAQSTLPDLFNSMAFSGNGP